MLEKLKSGLKQKVRSYGRVHREFELFQRNYALRHRLPDWKSLLKKNTPHEFQESLPSDAPEVLIATSTGGFSAAVTLESTLAASLRLRGARCRVLLCDSFLPACMESHVSIFPEKKIKEFEEHGPRNTLCQNCFRPSEKVFRDLGVEILRYSDFVNESEKLIAEDLAAAVSFEEISQYRYQDLATGEHAVSGALRFFARAELEEKEKSEKVLRRFLNAAILTQIAAQNLVKRFSFTASVFHHGIYVPQGLLGEVFRKAGVRVVNWNPAYRKSCFIFSHEDTYHHTMQTEPTEVWENLPWSSAMDVRISNYLKSRWYGNQDWIKFLHPPELDLKAIEKEIGIHFSKPTIGLLTNVLWDAQLHYSTNVFKSQVEWIVETIKYFRDRKDLQLLIRIHPAEVTGSIPSRQKMILEIEKQIGKLPPNVFLVSPESAVSTYQIMSQCDSVIIYGTKTGVELTSMGIPVVVAGEAWVRNKGFTSDIQSKEAYFEMLNRLPLGERLSEEKVRRAKQYAYHFFFRRMIPLEPLAPSQGMPPYLLKIDQIDDLMEGKSLGLDTICNGILKGTPFIYPDERML